MSQHDADHDLQRGLRMGRALLLEDIADALGMMGDDRYCDVARRIEALRACQGALAVITLSPAIVEWLEANDPMALHQADEAMKATGKDTKRLRARQALRAADRGV